MRSIGTETPVGTIIDERYALENKFFRVVERTVMTREGVNREPQLVWDQGNRNFSIAIATTSDGRIVFVEEPKYGQLDYFIVLPTGGVKSDESAVDAAIREFFEETGYKAENWKQITIKPIVGEPDKRDGGGHHVVVARNAIKVTEPEKGSTVRLLGIQEAFEEMRVGNIKVDMTMAALGLYLSAAAYPTI